MTGQLLRVGELRPNQLLHTYGVGAVADLPNLSVVIAGLDDWDLAHSMIVTEARLLAAIQVQLGPQVETLRTPPYEPESADPFGEWARIGVPVRLFPRWLRCSDTRCNRLALVESGLFELLADQWRPERVRYVHGCRGHGYSRPTAVPVRFVVACEHGHLDDFPWLFYVHGGAAPGSGEHTLRLSERGTTGEAANLFIECSCSTSRSMAPAFGREAAKNLPACRGRHPHLGIFDGCGAEIRTLGLGATNGWFAMQIRAFSLPLAQTDVDQRVAENWPQLSLLAALADTAGKAVLPGMACWPDVEQYGADAVWDAIRRRADQAPSEDSEGTLGGLVSLGRRDRLGGLIDQALEAARLCTSDPLCADHDPRDRRDLFGAACHACLFASETSCERGNHYLDRTLLVDTIAGSGMGFLR